MRARSLFGCGTAALGSKSLFLVAAGAFGWALNDEINKAPSGRGDRSLVRNVLNARTFLIWLRGTAALGPKSLLLVAAGAFGWALND